MARIGKPTLYGVWRRRRPSLEFRATAVASVAVVIDQLTKAIVRVALPHCTATSCVQLHAGPIGIVDRMNSGSGFSFGQGSGVWVPLTLLSVLLVPLFGIRLGRLGESGWRLPLALGLAAGGALGNLIDRVAFGGVTDFLVPGGYVTFNLADVAATTGTVMTVAFLVRNRTVLSRGLSRSIQNEGSSS